MQYTRGGRSGVFAGTAEFVPLAQRLQVLCFCERGTATLEPGGEEFTAYSRHLWNCEASERVEVFFDDASTETDVNTRVANAKYFHTMNFPDPKIFEHPCGPDMYRGTIVFESEDRFRLDWRVTGPRKLGTVISRFRRDEAAASG